MDQERNHESSSKNYESTHVLTIEPDIYWSNRSGVNSVDVEFDVDGNILVCSATDEILKFDQQGKFMSRFSVGQDREIYGMSCNKSGEIFMTDDKEKKVIVCDDEGQVTSDFSVDVSSEKPSKMDLRGLVVSHVGGTVFVVDKNDRKILRLSKDGELLNKISCGGRGWNAPCPGKGTICCPQFVALDASQNVLVNDVGLNRVQVFQPDGQFIRSLRGCRHPGNSLEFFNKPNGIAVFENGHVAVGCQSGLFACENVSYGPIVRRFDDKNKPNGILGTGGIATHGDLMAVALPMVNAESTVELFRYQSK